MLKSWMFMAWVYDIAFYRKSGYMEFIKILKIDSVYLNVPSTTPLSVTKKNLDFQKKISFIKKFLFNLLSPFSFSVNFMAKLKFVKQYVMFK